MTYKTLTIALESDGLSISHNDLILWEGSYEDLPIKLSSDSLIELEKEGSITVQNNGHKQIKKWTKRRINNARMIAIVEYKILCLSPSDTTKRVDLFLKLERLFSQKNKIERFFSNQ